MGLIMEDNFDFIKEQIRNFITHCLGFQPEDMTGGEFANEFTWKTNKSEFRIIFYYGCTWKKEPNFFDYYIEIGDEKSEGSYPFGSQFLCADEDAISKIIQPFKNTVENKKTLNVTSNIESKPFTNRYYVLQAFKDCHWSDVLFSRGNICTANKKARHYRNQNNCETRVVEIRENIVYSYEYEVVNKYDRNKEK